MVESIEELKKICTKRDKIRDSKRNKDSCASFFDRYYNASITWYFTKILLYTSISANQVYTPISANQVSLLGILIGSIASFMFIFGNIWHSLIGALMLNLWVIFDHCDGKVARYRHKAGGLGSFFDWLLEHSVPHLLFICVPIGLYIQFNDPRALIFGFSAVLFFFIGWTLGHVKEIIHMISGKDKSILFKRIKFSLSSRLSGLIIKIILVLDKFLSKLIIFKKNNRKKRITLKKEIIKEKGLAGHMYCYLYHTLRIGFTPIYFLIAAFVDIAIHFLLPNLQQNFNSIYLILIYYGIGYPLLSILTFILFRSFSFPSPDDFLGVREN